MGQQGVEQAEDIEERRLAALESYDILDTPREADFDDIARLAADICETPIAVINLIGRERQFFKAEVGLGVRETPLAGSFCAKAILEDDFLVVPDATRDPRFDCNPLVTGEPHLRFYAGALLKTNDGLPIGTVCVLDYAPRGLTVLQERTLRILARQVMTQLELRRLLRLQTDQLRKERQRGDRARREEEKLKAAQGAGRVGIFEIDVATDLIEISEEACRIFGLPVQNPIPVSVIQSLILEEDWKIASDVTRRQSGTAMPEVEYRIFRANDGKMRWIFRRARFVRDEAGRVSRMVGVLVDVTETKRRDWRKQALLSLGERIRDVTEGSEAAAIACEIFAQGFDADHALYGKLEGEPKELRVEADWTAHGAEPVEAAQWAAFLAPLADRLAKGETIAIADMETEKGGQAAPAGVGSCILVPIREDGRTGILLAYGAHPHEWDEDDRSFAWGVADRTYAALAKLRAEAEQRLLNQEISHRLKNTLAMVQAIAGQTLRNVTEHDAVDAFMARLQALSTAHEILLKQSWSSARLREIIEKVMALHADEGRVTMEGPEIPVSPRMALSLSLILHELATNALKYGSLTNETGKVDIRWSIHGPEEDRSLQLLWQERGGPPVSEPKEGGFGSRLIRMGLAGSGDVEKRYEPTGFVARFQAPISTVQERE